MPPFRVSSLLQLLPWELYKQVLNMDVSKNGAGPPKWMVYFMENPMNKWDDLEVPKFLETPIWVV